MRSPWLAVLMLLVYLLLVLMAARIFDLIMWYQHGVVSMQLVDPFLLSVRQIKHLLDNRGISYAGYAEKKELAQLLEDSAEVVHGEVEEIPSTALTSKTHLLPVSSSSYFTNGSHFYEEVEDTSDSVWLVQVVVDGEPLLDDYTWRLIHGQLKPFAIRTGIFTCGQNDLFCKRKGWKRPLLLLALPRGTKPKDKVILKYLMSNKYQLILQWIRQQLSVRVHNIKSVEEVEREWLYINKSVSHSNSSNNSKGESLTSGDGANSNVQVLLLTHCLHPPLFLAALSFKFSGRIKFGMFSVKKEDSEPVHQRLKLSGKKLPYYLVITPEKTVVYGRRRMEYFNLRSLNTFLRCVQPEVNDVFLSSLILLNMIVSLSILQISAQTWWKCAAKFVWILVSYNLWLFSAWLIVLATGRFSLMTLVTNRLLILLRIISLSDAGSNLRVDFALLSGHPFIFAISFITYILCAAYVIRRWKPDWLNVMDSDHGLERHAWWEVLPMDSYFVNYLFRPMTSVSRPLPPSQVEIEEGLEMLIERLAVPNLWLQPVVSNDYIKELPIWLFRGWSTVDAQSQGIPEKSESSMTSRQPKVLEDKTDKKESQKLTQGCCSCAHDHIRLRCNTSPKPPHTTKDGETLQDSTTQNCNKSHNSQCHASGHCQISTDCCSKNTPSGDLPEGSCVYSNIRTNFVLRDDGSHSLSESECDESELDGLGWTAPNGMLPTQDCAVCLESYRYATVLCGLPCGHNYHERCILAWLQRDNHHCPVCRWPAYHSKHLQPHLHRE